MTDPAGDLSPRSRIVARVVMSVAKGLGTASLAAFGVALLVGLPRLLLLTDRTAVALGIDLVLCLAFFVQHSGMVRPSVQRRMTRWIPDHLIGAVYTVVSGATLVTLLVLWQPAGTPFFRAEGPVRWLAYAGFVAGVAVFFWAGRSMEHFDGLGVRTIAEALSGQREPDVPMIVRGPYRWVRHPMYTSVLMMLWCHPVVTADRLLFNVAFTVWLVIGARLEERDLAAAFGEDYRRYRERVPMLVPRIRAVRSR